MSSAATSHSASAEAEQSDVQQDVHSVPPAPPQSVLENARSRLATILGAARSLNSLLLGDGPRALQGLQKKIEELTDETNRQKGDAELAAREYRATIESLHAELQLKNDEVEEVLTEMAERDTAVAKVQAGLEEREITARELRAEVSGFRRLFATMTAQLTSCQRKLDHMEGQAQTLRREGEELRMRDTGALRQELEKLEGDLLSVRKENAAFQGSHLALHAENKALRAEKRKLTDRISNLEWENAWLKHGKVRSEEEAEASAS